MRALLYATYWLEVLGGARGLPQRARGLERWRPLLWIVLLLLVVTFVGRSTKFIYVDF